MLRKLNGIQGNDKRSWHKEFKVALIVLISPSNGKSAWSRTFLIMLLLVLSKFHEKAFNLLSLLFLPPRARLCLHRRSVQRTMIGMTNILSDERFSVLATFHLSSLPAQIPRKFSTRKAPYIYYCHLWKQEAQDLSFLAFSVLISFRELLWMCVRWIKNWHRQQMNGKGDSKTKWWKTFSSSSYFSPFEY